VNFGPGDPTLAHTQAEHVAAAQITTCADVLRRFIETPIGGSPALQVGEEPI
jgi:succinyl-diaminopimelate desuccinylase